MFSASTVQKDRSKCVERAQSNHHAAFAPKVELHAVHKGTQSVNIELHRDADDMSSLLGSTGAETSADAINASVLWWGEAFRYTAGH